MINLRINGQPVQAEDGCRLLKAIEKAGFRVPTLCNHPALTPYGACRLCVVEVQSPGRPASLQSACSYPALEGIVVATDTEQVKRARRLVAELLLARCPDSEILQRIAREQGVGTTRFPPKNDDCIYCGLCVRMCKERMGRSAIGFTGRGPRKKLEAPFGKHNPSCWTCGACDFVCPVGKKVSGLTTAAPFLPIPDEHNLGLCARAAAFIPYPQAVPNKAVIDPATCVRLNHGVCGTCLEVCEANAIDFEQKEERIEIEVGAVVLAPGFACFDARTKAEFGYGVYPNVVSALEFERILSASGPFSGKLRRPSDHRAPKRIAFLQCVGSRDAERDYCSSVCCMYATKEAIIAKEHAGEDLHCDIFFMDLRAFGKGFEDYYERAKRLGVGYIRCRPARIEELPGTRNLRIEYLAEEEIKLAREYDLVVLATGLRPSPEAADLAQRSSVALNEFGFCRTSTFHPLETSRHGVLVAGPFAEPKDIPETVMQASGAAAIALGLLKDAKGSLATSREYPPEQDVRGQEPRIGVFVCHCGTNIGGVVSVPEVVEYAKTLAGVVHAEGNLYTCANDTQERIKARIEQSGLNRVIVASCTPRTHEPLFRNTIREAGLNPYLFEMANIRDQCSWVHMHEPERATRKAKDLVRIAAAKSRLLEPLISRQVPVTKAALVIGGGLAGMSAAVGFARQDFEVFLVEREPELGGQLRTIHYLLGDENPREELERLIVSVEEHPRIRVFTGAQVERIEGTIGGFRTRIQQDAGSVECSHGVVVIATGAEECPPSDYCYGQDDRVLTQRELEQRLRRPDAVLPATVVMIQCVGSRDPQRPYCSRVCCAEAIKNALRIKEISPGTNVYVLYRDIRTYGFKERFYTLARQKGVIFVRYDADRKPEVSAAKGALHVLVFDPTLGMSIGIEAGLVALSAGVRAHEDSKTLAQALKIPLNKDGFFLEAHMKLRPVDFATEGVFLCGMAHSPKSIDETIIQAYAAVARASSVLSREALETEAAISEVIHENCDGCAYCIDTCTYKAISLIEFMRDGTIKKVVETDETACKGCGSCQGTCPKNAIFVRGFKPGQITAQILAALGVE